MSTLVPVKEITTPQQAGAALANVVDEQNVKKVIWFAMQSRTSVILFVAGISLLLLFFVLRVTRKL